MSLGPLPPMNLLSSPKKQGLVSLGAGMSTEQCLCKRVAFEGQWNFRWRCLRAAVGDGSQESLPCDSNQKILPSQLLSLGSLGVEKPGEGGQGRHLPQVYQLMINLISTPLPAYTSLLPVFHYNIV